MQNSNPKEVHVNLPYSLWDKHYPEIKGQELNLEVYFDSDDLDTRDYRNVPEIVKLREDGRGITFHGPFEDLVPGSKDRSARGVFLERMRQVLELADRILPKVIVVHPGIYDLGMEQTPDSWFKWSADSWREVIRISEGLSVVFALENIYERTPDRLKDLIDRVDHPRFRNCFDIGHFNVCAKIPLDEWLDTMGPYIVELHVHNNFGLVDDHLGIPTGTIDFDRYFETLGKRGLNPIITLEPHTIQGVRDSLHYLGRRFGAGDN